MVLQAMLINSFFYFYNLVTGFVNSAFPFHLILFHNCLILPQAMKMNLMAKPSAVRYRVKT
jgi:hypothetical protein